MSKQHSDTNDCLASMTFLSAQSTIDETKTRNSSASKDHQFFLDVKANPLLCWQHRKGSSAILLSIYSEANVFPTRSLTACTHCACHIGDASID